MLPVLFDKIVPIYAFLVTSISFYIVLYKSGSLTFYCQGNDFIVLLS